jgi:hypothetical protein
MAMITVGEGKSVVRNPVCKTNGQTVTMAHREIAPLSGKADEAQLLQTLNRVPGKITALEV